MVGEGRATSSLRPPGCSCFPAGAIALLVVGIGFMSDGLRRMLLPGGVSG